MAGSPVPQEGISSHGSVRVLLWSLLIMACGILLWKGILPALQTTRGDFANYYTASRLLVDGVSLEEAYRDFTWFQQQMDRYGIRNQVGGFIPHPPPTALVFLPLTPLDALLAKRVWILLNIALAVLAVFLLARTSRLHWLPVSVMFMATGYGLLNNFLFGQLYLLLLNSILLSLYLFQRGRPIAAGVCLGILAPVKYVGLFFLPLFLWKKQWILIIASALTILVLVSALLLVDFSSMEAFSSLVLPRYLKGELQDPYSLSFQSWSSLYRRLFLYEETLNPAPIIVSPLAFFVFKNATVWILAFVALFVWVRVRFPEDEDQLLFRAGWIPLVLLLLSPGTATYHFLLLSMSAIFFVKILLKQGRLFPALALVVLYTVLNLPHYMSLRGIAGGWLTPLAYTRLWLLLFLFLASIVLFRSVVKWQAGALSVWVLLAGLALGLNTALDYSLSRSTPDDGARRLSVESSQFSPHLSLILATPDLGSEKIVFGYCEILDDRYAIYSVEGDPWIRADLNYYNPDLAPNDQNLLLETVSEGHNQIWWSRSGRPEFLVEGRNPRWDPGGERFVFEGRDQLQIFDLRTRQSKPLPVEQAAYEAEFSPGGEALVYCVREKRGSSLQRIDLSSLNTEVLFNSSGRIARPRFSSDGGRIVLTLGQDQGQDIWGIDLVTGGALQLTWDPALDRDPIWDEERSRILFLSDRGRGLGCTTLYWLPIPEQLR